MFPSTWIEPTVRRRTIGSRHALMKRNTHSSSKGAEKWNTIGNRGIEKREVVEGVHGLHLRIIEPSIHNSMLWCQQHRASHSQKQVWEDSSPKRHLNGWEVWYSPNRKFPMWFAQSHTTLYLQSQNKQPSFIHSLKVWICQLPSQIGRIKL